LPGIGNLFKTRSSSKEKTNLMVFLRPKILVDGAQMASETSAKYNYMRGMELARGKHVDMQPNVPQPTMPDLKDLQPSSAPPVETPKARARREGEAALERQQAIKAAATPPATTTVPAPVPAPAPTVPTEPAPVTDGPHE